MNHLTKSNRNASLSSGLGMLEKQRSLETNMSTRILSVFNLLKRVGFAVLLLGAGTVHGQPIDTVWSRTTGGSIHDFGLCVLFGFNGEVITGSTGSLRTPPGEYEALVSRFDVFGNETSIVDSNDVTLREARAIFVAPDENIILGGTSHSLGFNVVKIDPTGNVDWVFEAPFPDPFFPSVIISSVDSLSFIVVHSGGSSSFGDVHVYNLDNNGDTVWTQRIGGPGTDRITEIFFDSTTQQIQLFGSKRPADSGVNGFVVINCG